MMDWNGINMQCIKECKPSTTVQYKHDTLQWNTKIGSKENDE